MNRLATALIFGVGTATLNAFVVSAADVEHGEQLARRWCVACHVVAPDQQGASTEAPPFRTIARKPDFNAARLALFLLDPHCRTCRSAG
jgi:mono/diheme cytochrome c family protein